MRVINNHNVYGTSIHVKGYNEEEARTAVRTRTLEHIWEIKEISQNLWEAYVSDNAFALND